MDLIEKIITVLSKETQIEKPNFELKFDENQNVKGYIASESFYNMEDDLAQSIIWNVLNKNLDTSDLSKILAIFNETPVEKAQRLFGNPPLNIKQANIWFHIAKDLSRYWIFVDVTKQQTEYTTFFIVLNAHTNFFKSLIFSYPNDVIQFMELKPEEVYSELYNNSFNNAVSELKADLMKKHEELEKKGVYWKNNIYSYVYENVQIIAAAKKDLLFSDIEIKIIEKGFQKLKGYSVNNIVKDAIANSKMVNQLTTSNMYYDYQIS